MNLENFMLSKRRQTTKVTYNMIPPIDIFRIGKSLETESRLMVSQGLGQEGMGSDYLIVQCFLLR